MKTSVVVPWHNREQIDLFLASWQVSEDDSRLLLQRDIDKSGCAITKNRGIVRAIDSGADVVIVLDDDCFPADDMSLGEFIDAHLEALEDQEVEAIEQVTFPASRGTPYFHRALKMPVAASMGFWDYIGDYDAASQLVYGATSPMKFSRKVIWQRYFPLCGMNLAFKRSEWPWCQFIDVDRFDDIWQGFLWQKKAYSSGQCFNLKGPIVRHSRQSNVWANLKIESQNLEKNETIWQHIHEMELTSHAEMCFRLGLRYTR